MTQILSLPFPNSWYCVAFSDELPPGKIVTRTLAGHELVIFRTKSGQPCVMDAFCPHLGAHLGLGGTVVSEEIRCLFHHFRFDTSGTCVATGYGTKPPPTARQSVAAARGQWDAVCLLRQPEPGPDLGTADTR